MGIPPVIIRYKKDRIFHNPSSYWATPTMEFPPIQRIQGSASEDQLPKPMPRVLGLPEVHGSLLWGYSNWMAYGQSYRDMDDWEPLFTILGHLHIIDTEDRRRSVRFWARRFAEALAQMLVLKPNAQCRIVGQRREASNGWWAAKDSLRTLRKAKSWTCWGVASQTHPESPKRTQNLLLVSSRLAQYSPAGMIEHKSNAWLDPYMDDESDKRLPRSKHTTSGIKKPWTAAAALQSSTSVSRRAAPLTCMFQRTSDFFWWFWMW